MLINREIVNSISFPFPKMSVINIYVKCKSRKDIQNGSKRCSLCCVFLNCHVIKVMSKNIIEIIGDKKNFTI
jgi:hypothetical protein